MKIPFANLFLFHTQHPRPSSARSCAGSGGREPHPLRLHMYNILSDAGFCLPSTVLLVYPNDNLVNSDFKMMTYPKVPVRGCQIYVL